MAVETTAQALARLKLAATDEDLADGGRYFRESCSNLTECRHDEVGEYQNSSDGELIEELWNAFRRGTLIVVPHAVSLVIDTTLDPLKLAREITANALGDAGLTPTAAIVREGGADYHVGVKTALVAIASTKEICAQVADEHMELHTGLCAKAADDNGYDRCAARARVSGYIASDIRELGAPL